MDKNITRVLPFSIEKGKWRISSGKFMARPVIKGYKNLLTGDKKVFEDDTHKTNIKYFLN